MHTIVLRKKTWRIIHMHKPGDTVTLVRLHGTSNNHRNGNTSPSIPDSTIHAAVQAPHQLSLLDRILVKLNSFSLGSEIENISTNPIETIQLETPPARVQESTNPQREEIQSSEICIRRVPRTSLTF